MRVVNFRLRLRLMAIVMSRIIGILIRVYEKITNFGNLGFRWDWQAGVHHYYGFGLRKGLVE